MRTAFHERLDTYPGATVAAPALIGLPRKFARGTIELATEPLSEPDIRLRLSALGSVSAGWVCTTDRHQSLQDAVSLPAGVILSAEVALDSATSIHVRRRGRAWLWTRLTERLDNDASDYAFDDVLRSQSRNGYPALRYRTWWRAVATGDPPVQVYAPYASRFVGWEREDS